MPSSFIAIIFTANDTNGIAGYTLITDINNNVSRYDYTNSLITKITDPLNQIITQNWYWTNDTFGGYQRSLRQRVDKRGLAVQYFYDSYGNIVTNIVSGADLTGDGKMSATNSVSYNTNNLPLFAVDTIGNQTKYTYTNAAFPYLPTTVEHYASNGNTVSINALFYGYCSNIVVNGNVTITNQAFGILQRTIRALGSADAATNDLFYDGRGFVTSSIKYSGTADPNITNYYFYNNLDELVQQTDAAGRTKTYDYDGMGRVISKQVFDTGSLNPMYWENSYFDENGDLTWVDGPRYNPEGYIWRDYDGAGRKTQEIHWRSRAKADGSGVEAEQGDNLYATTFYQYDGFGNLKEVSDQLGNYSRMAYDAIGQLVDKRFYAPNQAAPISVEKYAYEPGGQVSVYTNALGGVTLKYYTTTGKLKQQSNPDGSTLLYTYYMDGRPRREYLSNGNYYETTYDDADRLVKRTFSSDASYSETKGFDRRGNLIVATNAVGAVFQTVYDGLDRAKQNIGPVATATTGQQNSITVYDNCGKQVITTNALGEYVINNYDALGRVVTNAVYDALGNRVSITTTIYSPDFNSVTTMIGSGTSVISNTVFTDTYGKKVLTQQFPTNGVSVFAINRYDITEHLVSSQDELQQITSYTNDSLYRLAAQVLPDGATTVFSYNPMGNLTNRTMPGGLTWSATFDSANRMLSEQLKGGSSTDRQFTYQYYASGMNIGQLQTKTDVGRNVTDTANYDAYLRLATNATSGTLPDQNLACIYQYDQRGLATNITQIGATSSDIVQRSYDAYKQLTEEQVWINGAPQSDFAQNWDGAGRRIQLAQSSSPTYGTMNYGYRADGLMTSVNEGGNNYFFAYGDNGLLTSRSNPWRTLTVNQRDGQGRLFQETATVGISNVLAETLTWRTNFEINSYAATRIGAGAWNDSRVYQYNSRNQLVSEPLGITNNILATNNYAFDATKLGVLTGAQWSGGLSNNWQATVLNSLAQITAESWNQSNLTLRASGSAVSASSVSAKLDGSAVGSTLANGRWYSDLTLAPGSHTLAATANYAVGQFAATATSAFSIVGTNNALDYFDAAGNVTNRVFASGKTQVLTWDGWGRLVGVVEQDTPTNGFNWTAVYDGLGRRLRTTQTPVVNGVTNAAVMVTLDSFFDPLVEFEELGVAVNGARTWKVMGPDLNGRYGGMQGVGGLEATVRESDGTVTPVLDDYFGNVLATISGTAVNWNPVRVSGYGPVLGYQSPTLTAGTPLAETLLWRTHRIDPSGFYYLGARYYDPLAGHFLSPDPLGHAASMDLYSAFNGDPVNNFDPDGRAPIMGGATYNPNTGEIVANYNNPPYFIYPSMPSPPQSMAPLMIVGGATSIALTGGAILPVVATFSELGVVGTATYLSVVGETIGTGAAIGAAVNGAVSTGYALANNQPWQPAFFGGATTGAIIGGGGEVLAPFYGAGIITGGQLLAIDAGAGFVANFAGNSVTQTMDPTYGASYNLNQALASGTWGYFANPIIGGVTTGIQSIFAQGITESSEYKALQAAFLDFPLGVLDQGGEKVFQQSLGFENSANEGISGNGIPNLNTPSIYDNNAQALQGNNIGGNIVTPLGKKP
jgi:RHS repeat-associated protein